MLQVANPIYDTVFKYLLEDQRIAKTILSALLKREVVSVTPRPHEYTNKERNNISMFRIDFGAEVRQDDGSLKLVLIELQKTWLETETLRFRQYLGTHYADPNNISKEDNQEGYAIPMVAVYVLGHRVGDIEEPVLYVNHESYDYNGNVVTKGLPNKFVDSLVHSSIIVQIPLLRGQLNNRLDKVLSVFDQRMKDKDNQQVINIDEANYENDSDMLYIIDRLIKASCNAKVRKEMTVEDEFFSVLENRDTAIMMRDKRIAEQDNKIAEQGSKIVEQDNMIAEQGSKIVEQGNKIAEQGSKIVEQDNKIAEQGSKIVEQGSKIAEQGNVIAEQGSKIAEQDTFLRSMIRVMLDNGMSVDDIARQTGKSVEEIKALL